MPLKHLFIFFYLFWRENYVAVDLYLGAIGLGLLLATSLLELQLTKVHDSSSEFVNVFLIGLGKAENIEGFL